ncbi:MAG: chromosomal replication initiator protein DnaA [Alphaproteobacteria bacterium]|nr:MAG: chromosomal replication initiator protein DnaA [Alphaproteobacteria bacterium]
MENNETGLWTRIQAILKAEIGDHAFNAWIQKLNFKSIEDGTVLFSARTPFVRDWVRRHYADRIRDLWSREGGKVFSVDITVEKSSAGQQTQSPATARGGEVLTDSFGSVIDPRYTFDSFVVGKSNEFAYAAAKRVAESKEVPFNPLFLHGGVGLGKTHLMHAIATEVVQTDPKRKIMYMSAEKFMYQFISAIRGKTTVEFKRQFRTVELLMIDDVQFIANKESTQEEFFHTFNALVDNRRQVVISADRSPTDLAGIEERIRSRLGWGLVADVHPTDYELRLGILQSKALNFANTDIAKDVLEFLAAKITSNVRELEGALNRVVAYAELTGQAISIDMTRSVLQDLLRANDRKVTIDEIQRQVSDYYNLRLSEILSARRARDIARPRQVAMYLAKRMTSRSLPEIGRKFGGRDHTTVIHAVRKIDDLRRTDSTLEDDINRLSQLLEG